MVVPKTLQVKRGKEKNNSGPKGPRKKLRLGFDHLTFGSGPLSAEFLRHNRRKFFPTPVSPGGWWCFFRGCDGVLRLQPTEFAQLKNRGGRGTGP